jgi:hypothetical protein
MADLNGLGFSRPLLRGDDEPHSKQVVRQNTLHRVLTFSGRSIDDVVNNPIVKNEVFRWYKLHKWIHREMEIGDLERQWNSI